MVTKETSEKIIGFLKEQGVTLIEPDDIKIIKESGKGGFGKVYQADYKGINVASKELFLTSDEKEESLKEISNEINFIHKAQHDRLPKFYGVSIINGHLNLVFEFIKGLTMKDAMELQDDKQKLECILQLCEILEYLHSRKLIHRDIKPPNIMIEEGNKVRLIDFGISKIASKTQTFTKTSTGTTAYMAPECFDVDVDIDPSNDKPITISNKTDMWAVGTLTSEIFSNGIIPWSKKCKNVMAIEIQLVKKKPFPIPEEVKNDLAIKIIKACTLIEPSERASATDIIALIKENMKIEK